MCTRIHHLHTHLPPTHASATCTCHLHTHMPPAHASATYTRIYHLHTHLLPAHTSTTCTRIYRIYTRLPPAHASTACTCTPPPTGSVTLTHNPLPRKHAYAPHLMTPPHPTTLLYTGLM